MVIVGVCGASGSGKSTLAERIRDSLSCTCTIIGQDCYYKSFPDIPFADRCHLNYDDPEIFDYDEMLADLHTLSEGKAITKKGYDYPRHLRADSEALIDSPDVLIIEGIHIFYDARIREMMSLKVYMHVDTDICLLRRIHRDMKSRGRSIESISEQYLSTVKPMYEKYIQHYIKEADFAIMRGGHNIMAIDAISAYLTTKVLAERFARDKALSENSEKC